MRHKCSGFVYLVALAIRERWRRTLLVVLTIAFGVAVGCATLAFSVGFVRRAIAYAEKLFPRELLTVKPRSLDLAAFRFHATAITDETVERLKSLPGVAMVAPQLSLKMPLRAEGDIMGQKATTDIVVVGVEPALVKDDVAPGFCFDFDEVTSLPIPCLVPRFFLDMYNLAYADSLGLPKLSESYPIGKHFSLVLGETYLLGQGARAREAILPCRIVGLTAKSALASGLLIPIGHARALNAWYGGPQRPSYNAVHLLLGQLDAYDDVTSAVRAMGLTVESQGETLDKFLFVARIATASALGLTSLVLVVAAVAVWNTFSLSLTLRRGELAVLRAVGATRRYVLFLLLTEAALVGWTGGLMGSLTAFFAARALESTLATALTSTASFLPGDFFQFSPWIFMAGTLCGSALVILTVWPLAWHHVSGPTSRLLNEFE